MDEICRTWRIIFFWVDYQPAIERSKALVEKHFDKVDNEGLALINKNFNSEKPTVIFLAGNGGIYLNSLVNIKTNLSGKYNFAFIDYPCLEDKKCSVDTLVEHSQKCLDQILEKLKSQYGVSGAKGVQRNVILSGFSLGAMVATKLAARNKGTPFKLLLNLASPINMRIASKEAIKNTMPIILATISCD